MCNFTDNLKHVLEKLCGMVRNSGMQVDPKTAQLR